MTLRAIADTHAVIWYLFGDGRLSAAARDFMESTAVVGDQVGLSSITLAEIVYLTERGRIRQGTLERLLNAMDSEATVLAEFPLDRQIVQVMRRVDRSQVPDLPDRIIAATALCYGVPLISRDRKIQVSDVETMW